MIRRFNKILDIYTKYLAVWVVVLSAAAYFKPGPFTALKPYLNLFFAVTMFGIGAVLKVDDFRNILRTPGIIAAGVIAQFTIMPLGAFFLARIFDLPPAITVGLILTGSAPGAMASNVLSYIARADVAYSVSLTSVSTLLTPVVTPGLTYLLANSVLEVDFWSMFTGLLNMVVLPLMLGFLIRHYFSRYIQKIEKVFPAISATFIVFICALVIALNKDRIAGLTAIIFMVVVILNIGGMLAGYGVGMFSGFGMKRRRTLSIEIGMQNAGLGTVLALKHFNASAAIPTAAFVFVCIFTASIAAEYWRSIDKNNDETRECGVCGKEI